jgi:hypothetical protein
MNIALQQKFMTEAQTSKGRELRQGIRRVLLKLAKDADVLPPSLFLNGVYVPRIDRAVCLGGFADIYLGSYQNNAVAVKRLRVTDDQASVNSVGQALQILRRARP